MLPAICKAWRRTITHSVAVRTLTRRGRIRLAVPRSEDRDRRLSSTASRHANPSRQFVSTDPDIARPDGLPVPQRYLSMAVIVLGI